MVQTIQITMTGQLPNAPYQSVFWTVYGDPDPTGALSGYGANYLINIGVDSITINGASVDPLSLTVGGDLYGTLPNPTVVGLQTHPIASTIPTTGQVLAWTGSAWAPSTTSAIYPATSAATPNTLALRDGYGKTAFSDDGGTSFTTYGSSITIDKSTIFSLSQNAKTSNTPTSALSITSQAPYASATTTNRLPGDIDFNIPAASGALAATTSGNYNFQFGGTTYLNINAIPGSECDLFFPLSAQLLGVTGVSSGTTLNLYAASAHAINFDIGGLPRLTLSYNPIAVNSILTVSDSLLIYAGQTPSGFVEISASDHFTVASNTIEFDGAPIIINSAGDVTEHSDNNFTVECLGNYQLTTFGGLLSIVNNGTGILLTDPAGGGITIDESGGGALTLIGGIGIDVHAPTLSVSPGTDFSIALASNAFPGGTGYGFTLQAGAANGTGTTTGGNLVLLPGVGGTYRGNVTFFGNPSSVAGTAGGSNVLWILDRTTAPSNNPTNGFIFYSESGVAKIRSGANTVTLGNKPSVTGSRSGGAALTDLLTTLATAGIITDNTSA